MNQEQYMKAAGIIRESVMLCDGSLATTHLRDSDLAFFKSKIEDNVKIATPQHFNCAMGALAESIDVPVERLMESCVLSDLEDDNGSLLSDVVGDEFGLSRGEQGVIMAVNDSADVEHRKRYVIAALGYIRDKHAQGEHIDDDSDYDTEYDEEKCSLWASEVRRLVDYLVC